MDGANKTSASPLEVGELQHGCDPETIDFSTTDEAEELSEIVGQARASSAVRFGIRMRGEGFNIYALGPEETDKRYLVRHFMEKHAAEEPAPDDLCYVHNFEEPHKPIALRLPAGTGCELAKDLDAFLEELKAALSSAYESEEYQSRRQSAQEEVSEVQQEAFEQLRERAREAGLAILRTPQGFAFAPMQGEDDEVMGPDEIEELPEEERERLEARMEELQQELQSLLRQVPTRQREARDRIRELDRNIARHTVRDLLEELRSKYGGFSHVIDHLDAVESDIVRRARQLISEDERQQFVRAISGGQDAGQDMSAGQDDSELRRYKVNVIVDHTDSEHAPLIYEDHPTYNNLIGRVEYLPRMGTLVTDFNMIKAGALHRANGGYLMLDARRVLLQPFAWEALKRAMDSQQVRIESPREALGLVSTVSLEPQPMDIQVKVVLLGSRLLYYLLAHHDPDFGELFKVEADFDDRMERTPDSERLYARLIADLVRREGLRPFDRSAVARTIEHSARLAGDGERLSMRTGRVLDLVREADHWAGQDGVETVTGKHVQEAIDQWTYRSSRIRDRIHEEIQRDTIYIDTEGEKVGQVNGLSVLQLGEFTFGRPNRITARVRLGKGEVVNIEREVELSGPIHSKGVLILSGFLGARYASEEPLSLSASLVFEQSYSGIEGDSASSAELYALLSAIAELPLKQSVAVTGSVNQHGEVQPIGGVNEKIEGFFDVCSRRGLDGEQGVLIPRSNVKHLMLRKDVVDAAKEGRFHIWPVNNVDEGMEILTGMPMGEPDEEGRYPAESVNHRVKERLARLAARRQEFAGSEQGEGA